MLTAGYAVIEVDGGCWPNPGGPGSWAWIASAGGIEIARDSGTLPAGADASNNASEYAAVLEALAWIFGRHDVLSAQIVTDSKMLHRQLTGRWRVRKGRYAEEAHRTMRFLKAVRRRDKLVTFRLVPRRMNERADAAEKAARNLS